MMLGGLLTAAAVASTVVSLILITLPSQYRAARTAQAPTKEDATSKPSVQIVVLGDLGRSPRMQYHALSFARQGGRVQLIGFIDSQPLLDLQNHPDVEIIALPTPAPYLQTSSPLLFLVLGPLKVLLQLWSLWITLGYRTQPSKWMLVQNPPSIPTLAVAALVCYVRNTRLVIDWHNLGYSILALKLGEHHPLVRISSFYERFCSRFAYCHLTVTDAMQEVVRRMASKTTAEVPILTLHDRPAPLFQPMSATARTQFLSSHSTTKDCSQKLHLGGTRLVVSSTSWTPDEDFSVLLRALCQYSKRATSAGAQLPALLVVITGKGPQQKQYVEEIARLESAGALRMVTVRTAWLSYHDYASLLGAADLGVSLHTSSSGVDLPMKVVDMFGAGLPVLGFDNYQAWPELVTEGQNGRGFSTAERMAEILEELFDPKGVSLSQVRKGAVHESARRWDDEWIPVAGRLFELVP